ncbi:hypothetical protein KQX54_006179 [Cotesia glomerata]|uniref:Uncharacterized protein n=1 Tax=Cotesia glomerata TaxID=32391 RepID=A0AAV7I400_COTGL|nr:hypothetical protein KQX54_006179 [Cotesia glomerata]
MRALDTDSWFNQVPAPPQEIVYLKTNIPTSRSRLVVSAVNPLLLYVNVPTENEDHDWIFRPPGKAS